MNKLILLWFVSLLFSCSQKQEKWSEVASGVWKVSAGCPEKMNLLSELELSPNKKAIDEIGEERLKKYVFRVEE